MRLKSFVVAVCLAGSCLAARAESFNFSFAGFINGSGTFTATATGTAGEFLVTGVSGSVDGSPITTLLAPGSFPTFYPPANDNLLFSSDPFLDYSGISFENAAGEVINIVHAGSGYGFVEAEDLSGTGLHNGVFTSFTLTEVASTPEPSSIFLLGTGLFGTLGLVRRRLS